MTSWHCQDDSSRTISNSGIHQVHILLNLTLSILTTPYIYSTLLFIYPFSFFLIRQSSSPWTLIHLQSPVYTQILQKFLYHNPDLHHIAANKTYMLMQPSEDVCPINRSLTTDNFITLTLLTKENTKQKKRSISCRISSQWGDAEGNPVCTNTNAVQSVCCSNIACHRKLAAYPRRSLKLHNGEVEKQNERGGKTYNLKSWDNSAWNTAQSDSITVLLKWPKQAKSAEFIQLLLRAPLKHKGRATFIM